MRNCSSAAVCVDVFRPVSAQNRRRTVSRKLCERKKKSPTHFRNMRHTKWLTDYDEIDDDVDINDFPAPQLPAPNRSSTNSCFMAIFIIHTSTHTYTDIYGMLLKRIRVQLPNSMIRSHPIRVERRTKTATHIAR